MEKLILRNGIAVIADDDHLTPWVVRAGRLDCTADIQALLHYIRPGSVAIDVGASIGDHTIAYLRTTPRVLAFEPNPVAFECLKHNCKSAECFNVALGAVADELYWNENSPNYGASSLSRVEKPGSVRVPVRPLDQYDARNVSFIKIDVEGWEVEVLLGAADTIKRERPVMCLEVCDAWLNRAGTCSAELMAWLARYGYDVRPMVPGSEGNPQWDALCFPKVRP